jgi:hypothetical protein
MENSDGYPPLAGGRPGKNTAEGAGPEGIPENERNPFDPPEPPAPQGTVREIPPTAKVCVPIGGVPAEPGTDAIMVSDELFEDPQTQKSVCSPADDVADEFVSDEIIISDTERQIPPTVKGESTPGEAIAPEFMADAIRISDTVREIPPTPKIEPVPPVAAPPAGPAPGAGTDRSPAGKIPPSPGAGPALPKNDSSNIFDQIIKLAGLRDAGILTEEEFTAKKTELLKRI